MKNHSSFKKAALLSFSMLIGISAANAHTTNLSTSIIENCDNLTTFSKNLDHNNAQLSEADMKTYVDARVDCVVEHQNQHIQGEEYFANRYAGSDRNQSSRVTLDNSIRHQNQHLQSEKDFIKNSSDRNCTYRVVPNNSIKHQDQHLQSEKDFTKNSSDRNNNTNSILNQSNQD